jgi:uncharacterized protein
MAVLAVAALSARMMAESAKQGGFDVVALDLFGDRDTRRASGDWIPIGANDGFRIDAERTLRALRHLSDRGDVIGWVAGGGFEGEPELLEQGAQVLPLIGTPAATARRVRNPDEFFGALDSERIGHPPIRAGHAGLPPDSTAWLVKNARGTGGWHIRAAGTGEGEVPDHHYFQRHSPGTPMSATFIANGSDARVLGFNELIVRRFGAHPFVYCGSVGPVPLPAGVDGQVGRAVRRLAAVFSLRGLGSLDFMLDGEQIAVLEVNPRPSASMAHYSQHLPLSLMTAHVHACVHAELPRGQAVLQAVPQAVNGHEIVYARRPFVLGEATSASLAQWPHAHDLPWVDSSADVAFAAGDPVCSVSATAVTAAQVRTQLTQRREALLDTLETLK